MYFVVPIISVPPPHTRPMQSFFDVGYRFNQIRLQFYQGKMSPLKAEEQMSYRE
jgi:hypothetical protein